MNSVGYVDNKFVAGNNSTRGLDLSSIDNVSGLSRVNLEDHGAVIWFIGSVFLDYLPRSSRSSFQLDGIGFCRLVVKVHDQPEWNTIIDFPVQL